MQSTSVRILSPDEEEDYNSQENRLHNKGSGVPLFGAQQQERRDDTVGDGALAMDHNTLAVLRDRDAIKHKALVRKKRQNANPFGTDLTITNTPEQVQPDKEKDGPLSKENAVVETNPNSPQLQVHQNDISHVPEFASLSTSDAAKMLKMQNASPQAAYSQRSGLQILRKDIADANPASIGYVDNDRAFLEYTKTKTVQRHKYRDQPLDVVCPKLAQLDSRSSHDMLLTFQDELRDMSVDESVFSLQNALLALKDIALRKARKAAMFRARKRMQQEIITTPAAGNNQQGMTGSRSEDQPADGDEHQTAVVEADNARLSNKSFSSPQNKLAPEILRLIENSVAFAKTATILFSANNATTGELQTGTAEEDASTSPADERNQNSASNTNGTTENKTATTSSKSTTSKKISSTEEQKIGIDLNFLESLIDCLDLVLLGTTLLASVQDLVQLEDFFIKLLGVNNYESIQPAEESVVLPFLKSSSTTRVLSDLQTALVEYQVTKIELSGGVAVEDQPADDGRETVAVVEEAKK
ncbi:unnamed protein product [Amoebophrya sp. A120]|nr:unnamed protein product [Amoebophrya sp. A120]|eukprot:GSA120T00007551001.1